MDMPFESEKIYPTCSADVILVNKDNNILLTKRGIDPYKGFWILPGGHIKAEEPSDAARREVFEEIGVEIKIDRLYGAYTSVGKDPRGPRITLVYIARIFKGTPQKTLEVTESNFFSKDNLPDNIGFHHEQILKDYFSNPEGRPII